MRPARKKPRAAERRHPFTLVRAEPLLLVISAAAAAMGAKASDDGYQALAWEVLDALATWGEEVEALAPDATRAMLKSKVKPRSVPGETAT